MAASTYPPANYWRRVLNQFYPYLQEKLELVNQSRHSSGKSASARRTIDVGDNAMCSPHGGLEKMHEITGTPRSWSVPHQGRTVNPRQERLHARGGSRGLSGEREPAAETGPYPKCAPPMAARSSLCSPVRGRSPGSAPSAEAAVSRGSETRGGAARRRDPAAKPNLGGGAD